MATPTVNRLDQMESRLASLERSVIARQRHSPAVAGRQVRLAKTKKNPNTNEYPEGVPDRYWVTFVNGNPPSYTERTDEPKETAWNLPSISIPENTTILVARHRTAGILSGQWYISTAPGADALGLMRFQLTAEMSSGQATARFLDEELELVGAEFTVWDPLNLAKLDGAVGARGWATWMSDGGRWEVVNMQHQARLVLFKLTEALDDTMSNADAEVVDFFDGEFDDSDPQILVFNLPTSVGGTYVFSGEVDARGFAYFSVIGGYRILQMECPAV